MKNIETTELSTTTATAYVAPLSGTKTATKYRTTKSAAVTKLLSRAKGATLAEIGGATGWQPHSCRAFLTGLRKKGKELTKEQRSDGSGAYRISPTVPEVIAP
ncbi:DUF3489 domain-containing protein [Sphingobium subterraneum]|uniref:DUF3489 domain-containing protein n=1 Tax=Sphingobium subterraneum TaxID=627688 RepID=A0A841J2Q5_9SPHN|nr:DUF3489 domain-containing protein [Sphingobium subterraneum]MBB6124632.1 hypothetical protein [Sphingobium subterraneum]